MLGHKKGVRSQGYGSLPLHQAPTKAQQSLVVGKQVFISRAKNMDLSPAQLVPV